MINENGDVKIVDSKCPVKLAEDKIIMAGRRKETMYTPAETVYKQSYDPKAADIFSLGIIYSLLLSKENDSEVNDLEARLNQNNNFGHSLQEGPKNLLVKMTKFLPAERITMEEILTNSWFQQMQSSFES